MRIEQLSIRINPNHLNKDMYEFWISVYVESTVLGRRNYNYRQLVDNNHFEDLFSKLMISAKYEIRKLVFAENIAQLGKINATKCKKQRKKG